MNCPKCGNEISENQKFCSNCGTNLENVEENTTENFTEEKSNIDIKQFFKKNLVVIISACIIGLPLIAFGTVKAVDYHNKVKPMGISFSGEYGSANIIAKYNKNNKSVDFKITQPSVIVEDWQIEVKNSGPSEGKFKIIEKDNIKAPNIEFDRFELITGKPVILYFQVKNQTIQDFVNIKYLLKNSQIGYAAPIYISLNTKERISAKNRYDKRQKEIALQEQQKAEDEEIVQLAQQYAYMGGYGKKDFYPIDFNPRKCLFKVKGICFGRPFYVKGMSYMDCKANKDKLGVKSCFGNNDIYLSTAYVCGGIKNMPTPDELVLLARDMYDNNTIDNLIEIEYEHCLHNSYRSCNEQKAKRNNTKQYLEYFREIYSSNTDFEGINDEKDREELPLVLLSNMVRDNDEQIMFRRRFYNNRTELRTDNRNPDVFHDEHNWHNPYSICVQRDKNYQIPKTQKFPIKVRPKSTERYNNEAENALF